MKIVKNLILATIVFPCSQAFALPEATFTTNIQGKHIISGQTVKLLWTVTPGAAVTINGKLQPTDSTGKGSMFVTPTDGNLTYSLKATDGTDQSITFAKGVELDGKGIRENYADGCVSPAFNDFLETEKFARYVPGNCRVVTLKKPYFYWSRPRKLLVDSEGAARTPMSFYLYRVNNAGQDELVDYSNNHADGFLILKSDLPAGMYKWKVAYTDWNGTLKESDLRTFKYLPDNSPEAILPTGREVFKRVLSRGHPRIIPRDSSGNVMTALAIKNEFELDLDLKNRYDEFKNSAVGTTLVTLNEDDYKAVAGLLDSVERVVTASYLEPDNGALLTNAKAWIRALSALRGKSILNEAHLENARIMRTLAIGYDILNSKLSNEELNSVREAIEVRMTPLFSQVRKGLRESPYDSHWLVIALQITQALMHIAEAPQSGYAEDTRLESAWEIMITTMGAWGGDHDSGWGNSLHYGWISLNAYAPAAASYRIMADVDVTKLPTLKKFGETLYSQTPRSLDGVIKGTFGDYSELGTAFFNYGGTYMRLFALASQNPRDEWFHKGYDKASLQPFYNFLLNAIVKPVKEEQPQKNSFLFADAGVTAFHSSNIGADDLNRSSVYFRSSPLGSRNHSHADNNSFTFVSRGKQIFVSGGAILDTNPFSADYMKYTRATRFKNAITFDAGIGQAEPVEPEKKGIPVDDRRASGKLINYYVPGGGKWRIVTGDAKMAYRRATGDENNPWIANVNFAYRTVAYNASRGILLIYDYAHSNVARNWEENYVTRYPTVEIAGSKGRALNIVDLDNSVLACVYHHGQDGSLSASENILETYFNNPEKQAPQYRRTFSHSAKGPLLLSITVIKEDCATPSPLVKVDFLDGATSKMIAIVDDKDSIIFDKERVSILEVTQ